MTENTSATTPVPKRSSARRSSAASKKTDNSVTATDSSVAPNATTETTRPMKLPKQTLWT